MDFALASSLLSDYPHQILQTFFCDRHWWRLQTSRPLLLIEGFRNL
jgi:hypothetical protein